MLEPNPHTHAPSERPNDGNSSVPSTLLTVTGNAAKLDGKFDIADSIQIECEVGGELKVGGKLVIGDSGSVHADVQTVDAIIHGQYEGNMVATGSVDVVKSKESEAAAGKPPASLVKEESLPQES